MFVLCAGLSRAKRLFEPSFCGLIQTRKRLPVKGAAVAEFCVYSIAVSSAKIQSLYGDFTGFA